MKTALVRVQETRRGYVELDLDDDDDVSQATLKRRAVELFHEGDARPIWSDGAIDAEAAWVKGTRCVAGEPMLGPAIGLRRCLTHDDMISAGQDRCHERRILSTYLAIEDQEEAPEVSHEVSHRTAEGAVTGGSERTRGGAI